MNKGKLLLAGGVVVAIMLGLITFVGASWIMAPLIAAEEEVREPLGVFSQQPVGLWVTGEGKVMAVPDVAILSLGVEAEAETVAEAQRQAAEAMNKVMKALTEHGVLEKDIQTQQYSIHPIRRWEEIIPAPPPRPFPHKWIERREEIIGYRVTNMVTAKIRKIDKAGIIIDATVKAGGDLIRIRDINFTVDDPLPYYLEAREKAVRDAVAKAKQITKAAGIKLGKPTYISEVGVHVPYPMRIKAIPEVLPVPAPPPTPISPGELEIRVNVQIVYRIS